MKRVLVCLAISVAILGATAALAGDGYCGWTHPVETHSCSNGNWIVCTQRFVTLASGHGGFICVSEIKCETVGSCDDAAGGESE